MESINTSIEMNCCRTCLSRDNLNAICVIQQQNARYFKELRIATGLKIQINDCLPQKICTNCVNFVQVYFKFREKCIEAHNTLLERINRCKTKEIVNADNNDSKNSNQGYGIAKNSVRSTTINDLKCEYVTENNDSDCTSDNDNTISSISSVEPKNDYKVFKIEVDAEDNDNNCKEAKNINAENNDTSSNDVSKKNDIDCSKEDTNDCYSKVKSGNDVSENNDFINDKIRITNLRARNKKSKDFKMFKMTIKDVLKKPIDIILEDKKHNKRIEVKYKETKIRQLTKEKKPENPVECKYCHKMFKSIGNLNGHIVIHNGKNTVCEHCGQRFTGPKRLLIHCKAKHGYERTDKCSYCDWRGCTREAVKIHERVHTGERPFACAACGAAFFTGSALRQHVATHLPEKTVKCDQCSLMFKSVGLMNIHKNRHKNPRKRKSRAKTTLQQTEAIL